MATRSVQLDSETEQRILDAAEPLVAMVLAGEASVEEAAERFSIPVWEAWAIALEAGVRRDSRTGEWYLEKREAHPEATLRRVGLKAPRPFPREQKPVFTEATLAAAAAEYEAGASLKTLAVTYGASPTTVRKYLLEAGVQVRVPGRRTKTSQGGKKARTGS